MALLQAPSGVAALSTFKLPLTGNSYTVDSSGIVSTTSQVDIASMGSMGFTTLLFGRNNLTASTDPGTGNDTSQDYAPGSIWLNTTPSPNRAWICASALLGAAVWIQISTGTTAGSASFVNLTLTGLLNPSYVGSITAFSGGGQGSATALTTMVSNVTTVAAPADSVALTSAVAGAMQVVINSAAANAMQVFGSGTDTINGIATGTGVPQVAGSVEIYVCKSTGAWVTLTGTTPQTNAVLNTNSSTTNASLTAANLTGGFNMVVLKMSGVLGSGQTATLPSMASVIAAIPDVRIGQSYVLRFINASSANFAWTLTNNSWTTFTVPNPAVGQNTFQDLVITVLSATTLSIVAIGNAAVGNTAQP